MGLFEEQPWLLIPLILAVTIAYDLTKKAFVQLTRRVTKPQDDLS
jgi:hypothetical protein